MDVASQQAFRATSSRAECLTLRGHADQMSRTWSEKAKWELRFLLRMLLDQMMPRDEDDLQMRRNQADGLRSIIAAIGHIELMVRLHPAQRSVFDEQLEICCLFLPETVAESKKLHARLDAVRSNVASLCHDATMRALRARY